MEMFRKEREYNTSSINKQNAESLLREEEGIDNQTPYTARERVIAYTDYDNKGSVAEIAVSRKGKSLDELLAEMQKKRGQTSPPTWVVPRTEEATASVLAHRRKGSRTRTTR